MQHHFGGQNQDRVYAPVCLIGNFEHKAWFTIRRKDDAMQGHIVEAQR